MKRVALFIGVNEYQDKRINNLTCAVSDASVTAITFEKRGFEVHKFINSEADRNVISEKIREISGELNNGDMFVFYFAGHGHEINDTHALILPSADINTLDQNDNGGAIPLSLVRKNFEENGKSGVYKLFILDCCRNNLLSGSRGGREMLRSRDISLVALDRKDGIRPPLILRSCQSGQCAYENDDAGHGYFTEAMIEALEDRSITDFSSLLDKMNLIMESKIKPGWQRITVGEYDGRNIPLFDGWTPDAIGKPHHEISVPKYQISSSAQAFADDIANLKSEGLFCIDRKLMKCTKINIEACAIPDGISEIYSNAFAHCSKLLFAALPDTITKIGYNAFGKCSAMELIKIPQSVNIIEDRAFSDCGFLKKIELPDSITAIKAKTFANCHSLEEFVIPPSVTEIGNEAFSGCTSLMEIVIPDSVKQIGGGAFSGCSKLRRVVLPENLSMLESDTFRDCNNLREVIAGADTIIPQDALPRLCRINRV